MLFNNANNIPQELEDLLKNVDVYHIQSNIYQDAKILSEQCQIQLVGLADTQLVQGAFCFPQGKVGTVAQSKFVGAHERPFVYKEMDFNKYGNRKPNDLSILHALMDARQPFLTIFKAALIHCSEMKIPLKDEENIFDYLWQVCTKVAGCPLRVVGNKSRPYNLTPKQNWKTSLENGTHHSDINNLSQVQAILAAQKGWRPRKKNNPAVKTAFESGIQNRKVGNRLRREAWWAKNPSGIGPAKRRRLALQKQQQI